MILRLLLLSTVVLHSVVVKSQELENRGRNCQETAEGTSCKAILSGGAGRASLLQVKSEMHPEPSVAAAASVAAASKKPEAAGHVAALLAVVDNVHKGTLRYPGALKMWLVVLAIVFALCIVACMVHTANEHYVQAESDKYATAPRTAGTLQGRGSPFPSQANSLPPTPGASARQTPASSARNLQSGAFPMMSGGRSPSSPEVPMPLPMTTAAKHLCPGLVVPHGNECILAVPAVSSAARSALPDGGAIASLNVQDLDGKSVIQAEVVLPRDAKASDGIRQIVLRAGTAPRSHGQQAPPLLAYCKAGLGGGTRKSVNIYDQHDELFASIGKDPATSLYVLTSGRASLKLFFEGDMQNHTVSVINDRHQLLADTKPSEMPFNPGGFYYRLRVVSNVDVGLILCALFAMECMGLS